MSDLGYVVLEWNQASYQPRVVDDTVHWTREDAEFTARQWRDALLASGSGRRERYTVAELTELTELTELADES